jgi:dolichyl-phosphate-mannose-protein mannosyltransferase
MKNRVALYIAIILFSSLLTHFLFYGYPNETVFDEVHFGKFISGYFTHEYFFDIHPPLGKLLISGVGYLAGFKPGFSFAEIGQKFPDNTYLWLRFLPTLAGALLPLVVFLLSLKLKFSRLAAFSAAMLVVFENALLVQSRFILLDSFLLLFGFLALLFYFIYRERKAAAIKNSRGTFYLMLAGIFGALSLSVKWTGATFLAFIIILEAIRFIREKNGQFLVKNLLVLIILPLVIYFSIFAIHLKLLTKSGPGDAFMSPAFQKTLLGNAYQNSPDVKQLNLLEKFKELNIEMYKANANLTAGHPYSSKWYTWPFMIRPIYYWYKNGATNASRIYFLGNPVIWWTSTVAIIYLLISLIRSILSFAVSKIRISDTVNYKTKFAPALLAPALERRQAPSALTHHSPPLVWGLGGAFLLNLLPFAGITRVMFLYHYIICLVFAIITLVYLTDRLKNKKRAFLILLIASFAAFVFFAPLTYGLPLGERAYNMRVWLKTWL